MSVADLDARPQPDRLTLRRLMLLIAGVAVGFWLIETEKFDPYEVDHYRRVAWVMGFGCSLAGPWIVTAQARRGAALAVAAYFWLMTGVGSWIFVPGLIYARFAGGNADPFKACLLYAQLLPALWLVVSIALVSPRMFTNLWRPGPWIERCGLALAVYWAPNGAWLVLDLYRDLLS